MSPTTPTHIIIVGAGVTGLTTATLIQRHLPKVGITILAAETPTTANPSADYASMWAGAHYRPIHPISTDQLAKEHEMAMRTAEAMRRLARKIPEAGVAEMPGVEYFKREPEDGLKKLKSGDVYASPGDGFRVLEEKELPPGVKWGCVYRSYGVNVPVYCRWLMDGFLARGGKIVQRRLSSASEVFELVAKNTISGLNLGGSPPPLVVNCSGRNFDLDPKVKIIRGQTVLVKQQYDKTITQQNADGTWTFVIGRPRNGGTIVGGTKEIGDWEPSPRAETTESLLQHCVESFPDFIDSVAKFDIVKINVGRRPWREGGYRFEIENIGPGRTVVHGYGAGGRGYELSWGAGEKILELVKECVAGRAKL